MGIGKLRKGLVFLSVTVSLYYLWWRLGTFNESAMFFSVVLYGAELYGFITSLLFFYMVWDFSKRKNPPAPKNLKVDVFIPTLNESVDILRKTIQGALNLKYPAKIYVLDDGNRKEIRNLCEEMGVNYIARAESTHGKAGNLNHALERTEGDYIAVFDADHVPLPDFLDKTLGYFSDEKVAFVQTPQDFYNIDSYQHRVIRNKLWHEQSLFFRVIMRGKDRKNTAFFCGSCAVVRRKALEEIGGFATGTVTEDLHTSIRLHARGWKSVYHPEVLAYGVAPSTFKPFKTQRERWGQGAMQVFLKDNPLFKRGLTLSQRINYFASMITYFDGFQKLIFYTAPLVVLLTGIFPIKTTLSEFLPVFIPHIVLSLWAFEEMSRGYGRYFLLEQYNIARFFSFMKSVLGFLKIRRPRFKVTEKENSGYAKWGEAMPQLAVLLGSAVGIGYAFAVFNEITNRGLYAANMFWAGFNLSVALLCLMWTLRRKILRKDFRFPANFPAVVEEGENVISVSVEDIHDKGCAILSPIAFKREIYVSLETESINIKLQGQVVYAKALAGIPLYRIGVKFKEISSEDRRKIIAFNFQFLLKRYMQRHDLPSFTPFSFFESILRTDKVNRKSKRKPVHMPGLILANGGFIPYTTEDLSDTGVGIITYKPIKGSFIHISLRSLDQDRTLTGRVIWSKEINFYGIKAYRYGIKFEELPSLQQEKSYAVT